ncbi:rhomboid family intramembrane serine protease [Altererythrobacter sp. SALINAS58]|uniref:rhomboid family intramembrane serine protease n=1 Tax=Alteripontixanthobacter muriae TaxID=2705546 RepID=UPI0015763985|nr:rhomboid family intramembrane serine protease [Alteripontixanthobacter muriae]NTZ43941.1 rhomboid family intramembrane serine protease [Alteripontixanthobacter muriae]
MNDRKEAPLKEDGGNNLFARDWEVPWHAHLLPVVLAALMIVIWLNSDGRMSSYAVSWQSLKLNPVMPMLVHMLAHGGLPHVLMNSAVLLLLSGPLISRLGDPPLAWMRYMYLLIGSGISGALLFLLLNLRESASMLGASGAVFGLLGLLARVHPATGHAVPIRSARTWLIAKFFVQNHLLLFAILALVAFLTGASALLAWEAHLGGLLFGFFAAPLFLKLPPSRQAKG